MYFNYTDYDAVALAKLIKTRQVSPEEVLLAAIHQIDTLNPKLNAVITTLYDEARAQLPTLDLSLPLAGVPMLLKDLFSDYQGIPTSFGSRWLKNTPAPENSRLVQRYLRAGLIIVGKTNVPEFGLGAVTEPLAFGATLNPEQDDITPGGSSGGSAAAVAAKMVPVAHANDGGGSIRIPASCCGVFGLKPTRGRTPLSAWNGLIVEHVITRTVRDSAALLDISIDSWGYSGLPLPNKSYAHQTNLPLEPLKIGYTFNSFFTATPTHSDCIAAVNSGLKHCLALGHHVEEVKLSFDQEALCRAYAVIVAAEINVLLKTLALRVGHKPKRGELELLTETIARFGEQYTAADYVNAGRVMEQAAWELNQTMKDIDILVTPTLSKPPVEIGNFQPKMHEKALMNFLKVTHLPGFNRMIEAEIIKQIFDYVAFTPLCNMTGHPAMSMALYRNQENLPIGVHFIGRFGEEGTLLQLAKQIEGVENI
ncbi:MAG: amidase [Legionellales bacterium]|nr:amidase [Legionellales bacterium]